MISCVPEDFKRKLHQDLTTFASEITYRKLPYDFGLSTLQEIKVKATKDHDKKFRSELAASFNGIVHL